MGVKLKENLLPFCFYSFTRLVHLSTLLSHENNRLLSENYNFGNIRTGKVCLKWITNVPPRNQLITSSLASSPARVIFHEVGTIHYIYKVC